MSCRVRIHYTLDIFLKVQTMLGLLSLSLQFQCVMSDMFSFALLLLHAELHLVTENISNHAS